MPVLSGGSWLRAELVKKGDILTFEDDGEWLESTFAYPNLKQDGTPHPKAGQPKQDLVFKVAVGSSTYDFRMNTTNQRTLSDAWGRDTADWVGNKAVIDICKVNVGGKMHDSIVLTPASKDKEEF
jgi:hypothetical protein